LNSLPWISELSGGSHGRLADCRETEDDYGAGSPIHEDIAILAGEALQETLSIHGFGHGQS
jgi:hypothetical protein